MADPKVDAREHAGSPQDRRPQVKSTAAYGLSAGLALATIHWLSKCLSAKGGAHWALPDDALLEMWIGASIPTVHLIGRIVNNKLQRLAGEENEDSGSH